jgi:hypothetical protein
MYIYICIYIYQYTLIYTYACTYTSGAYSKIRRGKNHYIYVCTVYAHMYIHIYKYVYLYIQKYICLYIALVHIARLEGGSITYAPLPPVLTEEVKLTHTPLLKTGETGGDKGICMFM